MTLENPLKSTSLKMKDFQLIASMKDEGRDDAIDVPAISVDIAPRASATVTLSILPHKPGQLHIKG